MSRIGKKEIGLPEKVEIKVGDDSNLTVEGPKGKLEWALPEGIGIEQEDGAVRVTRASEDRKVRAMHGTARSLVANMVEGVSNGFVKELEVQGVGFRAAVKGSAIFCWRLITFLSHHLPTFHYPLK